MLKIISFNLDLDSYSFITFATNFHKVQMFMFKIYLLI